MCVPLAHNSDFIPLSRDYFPNNSTTTLALPGSRYELTLGSELELEEFEADCTHNY